MYGICQYVCYILEHTVYVIFLTNLTNLMYDVYQVFMEEMSDNIGLADVIGHLLISPISYDSISVFPPISLFLWF